MNRGIWGWVVLLTAATLLLAVPILSYQANQPAAPGDPWAFLPQRSSHVDHSDLLQGPGRDEPVSTGKKNIINNY